MISNETACIVECLLLFDSTIFKEIHSSFNIILLPCDKIEYCTYNRKQLTLRAAVRFMLFAFNTGKKIICFLILISQRHIIMVEQAAVLLVHLDPNC